MLAFFLTAFLGAGEMLLLSAVLKNALAGNIKKSLIFVLIKLVLYAAVITPVVLVFKDMLIPAAAGYCVGMPFAAIIYAISARKKKGDNGVGHGSDS